MQPRRHKGGVAMPFPHAKRPCREKQQCEDKKWKHLVADQSGTVTAPMIAGASAIGLMNGILATDMGRERVWEDC